MPKYTISINLPTKDIRYILEERIAERVADEYSVSVTDLLSVRGLKKSIKEAVNTLFPRFEKAILKALAEDAADNAFMIIDDLNGYHGAFPPLDNVIDKFASDPRLGESLYEIENRSRLKRLKEEAANLGYKLTEIDE